MRRMTIEFKVSNMENDDTDWDLMEEIEGKLAETLYGMGYKGSLYSATTGNTVAFREES